MKKRIIVLLSLVVFGILRLDGFDFSGNFYRTANIWNHVANGITCRITWAPDNDPTNIRYAWVIPTLNQSTEVMIQNGHFLAFDCTVNNNASSEATTGVANAASPLIIVNINGAPNKLSLESH